MLCDDALNDNDTIFYQVKSKNLFESKDSKRKVLFKSKDVIQKKQKTEKKKLNNPSFLL